MDSCISPVLINIFVEHFELLAVSTFHTPLLYGAVQIRGCHILHNAYSTDE